MEQLVADQRLRQPLITMEEPKNDGIFMIHVKEPVKAMGIHDRGMSLKQPGIAEDIL